MNHLLPTMLLFAGLCLAVEPLDRAPLQIPEGAEQIDAARISFPPAHQARRADLLFKKLAGEDGVCVLRTDEASDLAGPQYKAVEGLKTILVKWSYLEPADEKSLDLVKTHSPTIHSKETHLYISSSGIDIGDVGKVVEGVLIVQVANVPRKVVSKLSRTGW